LTAAAAAAAALCYGSEAERSFVDVLIGIGPRAQEEGGDLKGLAQLAGQVSLVGKFFKAKGNFRLAVEVLGLWFG